MCPGHLPLSLTMRNHPPQLSDNQRKIRSLLAIRSTAESIKGLIQPTLPKEANKVTPTLISIPALDLPFPTDIGDALGTLGLSEHAYSKAHCKIQEWVQHLQNVYSLKFQQLCRNLVSLPAFSNSHLLTSAVEHMRFIYQDTYARYLSLITEHVLSKQKHTSNNAKIPFNNVSGLQTSFSRSSH